jgi:cytochrome c-type biogenesis protein CcmH/NrfG
LGFQNNLQVFFASSRAVTATAAPAYGVRPPAHQFEIAANDTRSSLVSPGFARSSAARSDWPKAEEQFQFEARFQPGNAEAAFRLGDALLQQGEMQEAAQEFRRSNSLRPDMSETLYSLGRAVATTDPKEAENAFARVIELEKETPLAAQAYLALAAIHRKQGKPGDATHDMQEFRRIQSLSQPAATSP